MLCQGGEGPPPRRLRRCPFELAAGRAGPTGPRERPGPARRLCATARWEDL